MKERKQKEIEIEIEIEIQIKKRKRQRKRKRERKTGKRERNIKWGSTCADLNVTLRLKNFIEAIDNKHC